jgi:hypothetical protein
VKTFRLSVFCVNVILALSAMPAMAQSAPSDETIPPEYQSLYDTLSAQLDSAEAFIDSQASTQEPSANATPIFAAELLPANGNRGEALLDRTTLGGTRRFLDALQVMGVTGVTLDIKLPVLLDEQPRAEEYLDFFRAVVADVRDRGMTLMIESGPAFSGTIFSPITYDYSGMTNAEYFEQRTAMLVTIAAELQPDYIAIGTEVTTEEMLTGLDFEVDEYSAFVHDSAVHIREVAPDVNISSGIGVWENADFVEALLGDEVLDSINLHIYPLATGNRDLIRTTFDLAEQIKAAGKGVVIGESWLYKADPAELTGLGNNFTELYSRDVYSFWSPLDVRFIELLHQMAEIQGYEYVSFYWATYFFGYVDYTNAPQGTPPADLFAQENRIAYENVVSETLSPTGQAFQQLLADS